MKIFFWQVKSDLLIAIGLVSKKVNLKPCLLEDISFNYRSEYKYGQFKGIK